MRIKELLEGHHKFNDNNFVKIINDSGEREIDFDLPDDLIYFMHNNDDVYRRHLYPRIAKCISIIKANKTPKRSILAPAIHAGYELYLKEYPIRELPDTLDDGLTKEICEKLHDQICEHISDGKYD